MDIYIHTYIHTHTYIHIHTPTYVRTYIHTYIHTYVRIYIHTYINTYMHTYIRTYIYTHDTHIYHVWNMCLHCAIKHFAVEQTGQFPEFGIPHKHIIRSRGFG